MPQLAARNLDTGTHGTRVATSKEVRTRRRVLPSLDQRVQVCFIDEEDKDVWWEAMVVDVGSMHRTGPTLCSGVLHYYKAHDTDEHECDFMFM